MKSSFSKILLLQIVLFGLFLYYLFAGLRADFLVAFVLHITKRGLLLRPWQIGVVAVVLLLPFVGGLWHMLWRTLSHRMAHFPLWSQGAQMALFLLVGVLASGSEQATLELHMARLCCEGKNQQALRAAESYAHPTPMVLALRTQALLREQQSDSIVPLANDFFKQPMTGAVSSKALRLSTHNAMLESYLRMLQQQNAQFATTQPELAASRRMHQRLLELLLDKQLTVFARAVIEHYDLQKSWKRMPLIYRQALVLYLHRTTLPLVNYDDPNTEANYNDFVEYQRKARQESRTYGKEAANVERNLVQELYGNTYWYYFFYQLHSISQ